ncbi:hypothetical protein SAMN02745166_01042 [Prosthecobacter debontii]|uniref:Uncharacterized protein n=1 Tax=Prosthecobacter debontii TaxID=48467 RepID=A0A1T4X4Y5_9BACT|nr:hypothetical protein [Prosthecobacter debontii]SKA84674.1 hypothetical protein SAMN02745166_01042 [Prosthecobacter debontii]
MNETTVYIGIDNGISGGIAAISITPGTGIIARTAMATQKTRKGNEIDVRGVWRFLQDELQVSNNVDKIVIIIEEPGGSKSASAAASMAASFAALRAMCELKGVRHIRITPQRWQKNLLKCGKGENKAAALTMARALWPDETWLESPRCRTPHDGIIDAALIAEYGRRQRL